MDQLDVISLRKFDAGTPKILRKKLLVGLRAIRSNRIEVVQTTTGIRVIVHKLPSRFDPFIQDVWAYLNLRSIIDRKYDLCIFGNADNALLAWLLKKTAVVARVIYDDWDFYPAFPRPILWRAAMKWRERICISVADTVVSVGSLLSELRKKQGASHTLTIPNGVDYHLFAKGQAKRPHPPTLMYMGTLAEEYGIDVSIRGFVEVQRGVPDARYLIAGHDEDAYGRYLHGLVGDLGLRKSVRFLGMVGYEKLPYWLAEADIGVALFRERELMKFAFPLKVVEYMTASLAVIGTGIGETGKIIRETMCGVAIRCSADEFAVAASDMLNNRNKLAKYQENARDNARQYDWTIVFDGVLYTLERDGTGEGSSIEMNQPDYA